MHAEELEHVNPQDISDLPFGLCRNHRNTRFMVDGVNQCFVNLMKVAFDESLSWRSSKQTSHEVRVLAVNRNRTQIDASSPPHVPIYRGYLAITEEFDKLTISLRSDNHEPRLFLCELCKKKYLIPSYSRR